MIVSEWQKSDKMFIIDWGLSDYSDSPFSFFILELSYKEGLLL